MQYLLSLVTDAFELIGQQWMLVLWCVAAVATVALMVIWTAQHGWVRGPVATLCRIGWTAPLFFAFFPRTDSEALPRSMVLKPVHVLIDDSESMQHEGATSGRRGVEVAEELIFDLERECRRLGCLPKKTRLSELDLATGKGYTPLANVLSSWLYKVGEEPWILISDGGDQAPTIPWSSRLVGQGEAPGPNEVERGLILGMESTHTENVWISHHAMAPFAFEDRPLNVEVTVRREKTMTARERIQVQFMLHDSPLVTANIEFEANQHEQTVSAVLPALPRGQHLVIIRALPTAKETALWDNTVYAQVEVMPNTVGVLHLLGAPSWDGRFLRRYLKAEPKYDLVSFFILRDPWDDQSISERELSLIPFPVDRLFREELPNFRVIILQNFSLSQFLQPAYQENLVKFVREGGGLLFLGGDRALRRGDIKNSPLTKILPFDLAGQDLDSLDPFSSQASRSGIRELTRPTGGIKYASRMPFRVEPANPKRDKRALANVYDAWEELAPALGRWDTAEGLHQVGGLPMKKDSSTVLLRARLESGDTLPFAAASYPGDGRALWVFSDSLWRLALAGSERVSRQVYNRFLHSAMTWLTRQELRKPLIAKGFQFRRDDQGDPIWQAKLRGPAARYFNSQTWQLELCGRPVTKETLRADRLSRELWQLTGPLPFNLAGGERCTLTVSGRHAAFGSVRTAIMAAFPRTFRDSEVGSAPQRLTALQRSTGARYLTYPENLSSGLSHWIEQITGTQGVALADRYRTQRNFFWILDTPWIWVLLSLMPLEVVARRWPLLTGATPMPAERRQ